MARALTIKNIYDKKHKTFDFDGVWEIVMGKPTVTGIWCIYGEEKNGKTWFALTLADYISKLTKVLYVSAEEGMEKEFVQSCERAKIEPTNRRLKFLEYVSIEELSAKLAKPRTFKVVFLDNLTVYRDELKNGALAKLKKDHPNVLFVCICHEENNEPYTATAKLAKRLAKIIVRVQGLACFVSGRCPGGTLIIDEEKAQLYHGTDKLKNK